MSMNNLKMKISTFALILFSTTSLQAMTKEWTVTKLNLDDKTKLYLVDFKNQAGIYKAEEKLFSCLQWSLADKKAVKVEFEPMGLILKSCEKVSTR